QRMAVDDAGRRRMQRAHAEQLGLHAGDFVLRDPVDVADAVGMRFPTDRPELAELLLIRRYDELSTTAVRDAMARAVFVEQMLALDAGTSLERALGVIDAGVDHLRVARAGVRADSVLGVQNDDFASRHGEL